jgi:hypothetical protein
VPAGEAGDRVPGERAAGEPAQAAVPADPPLSDEPVPAVPSQSRRASMASRDGLRTGQRAAGEAARRAPVVDHGPGKLRRRPATVEAPSDR